MGHQDPMILFWKEIKSSSARPSLNDISRGTTTAERQEDGIGIEIFKKPIEQTNRNYRIILALRGRNIQIPSKKPRRLTQLFLQLRPYPPMRPCFNFDL